MEVAVSISLGAASVAKSAGALLSDDSRFVSLGGRMPKQGGCLTSTAQGVDPPICRHVMQGPTGWPCITGKALLPCVRSDALSLSTHLHVR